MKTKLTSALVCGPVILMMFLFSSCKKESGSPLFVTFSNTTTEGTANANGEYTLTGHISSQTPLDKITLTRLGQAIPFLTDESTVKNKKEYDYSYHITGVTLKTTIIMDVYDQNKGRNGVQFVIKK